MRFSLLRVSAAASLAASLVLVPAHVMRAQAPATPTIGAATVTVLEAGAAPRQTLRYRFSPGPAESMQMRQKMTMNMEMGGMAMPAQAMPVTVTTAKFAVTGVDADGTAAVASEIVGVELEPGDADPALVSAMQGQMASLTGMTMNYRISPNGALSKMEVAGGGAVAAQASQMLSSVDQMSVAFPTEPVGVGARWKASRPVTQGGLTIQQDVEYLLTALSADSMVLDMVLTQSARDQKMDAGTMPAGATATVRSLDGKANGTLAVHFARLQPRFDMKMTMNMAIDVEMAGQLNSMKQQMQMEMSSVPVAKP